MGAKIKRREICCDVYGPIKLSGSAANKWGSKEMHLIFAHYFQSFYSTANDFCSPAATDKAGGEEERKWRPHCEGDACVPTRIDSLGGRTASVTNHLGADI